MSQTDPRAVALKVIGELTISAYDEMDRAGQTEHMLTTIMQALADAERRGMEREAG